MFRVWDAPMTRPTRDIDLMGYVENTLENLRVIICDQCQVETEPHGLVFDPGSVTASRIKEKQAGVAAYPSPGHNRRTRY